MELESGDSEMRRLDFPLVVLFLLSGQRLAAEESVILVDPYMGIARPEDIKYIADIRGPTRTVTIMIRRSGANMQKNQRAQLKGPLNIERVSSLLQAIFGSDDSYWALKRTLNISITGDEYRARVDTVDVCGSLCGGGISYFYTFDNTRWRYLYSCDRWVS